jgi:hypothetical protein
MGGMKVNGSIIRLAVRVNSSIPMVTLTTENGSITKLTAKVFI